MKRHHPPVVNLEIGFSDKDKTLRLLNFLATDPRVAVNILKARITERSAWLRLEIKGDIPRLFEVAAILYEEAGDKDPFWRPFRRAS